MADSSNHGPSQGSSNIALSVENVTKEYVRRSFLRRSSAESTMRTQALRGISLTVEKGETFGLLGPNGAGKTTLLKIIATLLYPTSGRVSVFGHDALKDEIRTRGLIGLVTCDERSFYWRLTGQQNLSFFAALYGLTKDLFRERSEELLETLGLAHAARQPYHTYSAGMKQKLAIARGLLSKPQIVLYDEPTRSLDPLSKQNIRRWILEARHHSPEQVHVIATNQLDEAKQLCDRVAIINQGKLIAYGTIDKIRERWQGCEYEIHRVTYRGPVANGMLKPDPDAGLFEIEQEQIAADSFTLRLRVARDSDALSRVLHAILRSNGTIVRCEAEAVTFDEVFCSLVLDDKQGPAGGSREGRPE